MRERMRCAAILAAAVFVAGCSTSTPRDSASSRGAADATVAGVNTGAMSASPQTSPTESANSEGDTGRVASALGSTEVTDAAGPSADESNAQDAVGPAPERDVSTAVGVSTDEIVISAVGGFGGALGPALEELYQQGFVTWQKQVNDSGGVHGRRVVVKKVDHKDTADGGVGACREILGNGSYLVMIVHGTGDGNFAAASCLEKAGVVNVSVLPDLPEDWRHTYTFIPSAEDHARTLGTFVKNVMHDGDKKLGIIYLTPTIYAASKRAYEAEARSLGMDVVATEAAEPNQASFTPQLIRLRDAGVENLAIMATFEATGILRDARALGWRPRITGAFWHYDLVTQAARDLAEGAMAVREFVTTDGEAFKRFEAARRKHNPSSTPTTGESLILYGDGLLAQRILEAAGENPTNESLVAGIESITDFDTGILAPMTWGPGDYVGSSATFPAVCCTSDWTWRGLGPAREKY